ncbi:MAG TPA: hypothetical protein VNC78_05285 [Actinomycetota bacterium]|nr:hypothetical protein [Actinomycetota bacterium]HVF53004.1 hypothetical protein [Actinomycetota bacterium]
MPEGLIIFAGSLIAFEVAAARLGRNSRDGHDWFDVRETFERGVR